jgi:Domain of unknown function (DUF4185)
MTTATAIRSTRYLGAFPGARTEAWSMIGQDGGQSIDLGDRALFVYSDTVIAALGDAPGAVPFTAPPASPAGARPVLRANCAGLSGETDVVRALTRLRYYTDDDGLPREILTPTPAEREDRIRFWPAHGVFIDGDVYLYYLGVQTIDPGSVWGFRTLGAGLAVLDPDTGECRRVRRHGSWAFWDVVADDLHVGVQVLRDAEYVYVFASVRSGLRTGARLARIEAGRITDAAAYEFLRSSRPTWGPGLAAACDLGECTPDYSVSFNPYLGKYALIYVDGYRKTLMLRTADELWGPYSPPQRLVRVPYKRSSELVYLAFEHPRFRKNAGEIIYVSYCQPYFTANSLATVRFR